MANNMKCNCTQRSILIAVAAAAAVYMILDMMKARKEPMCACHGGKSHYRMKEGMMGRKEMMRMKNGRKEYYVLAPRAIQASGGAPEGGLNSLPYKMECTPGKENGAYYTKNLTPGGFCGDQAYVNSAMHKYSIEDGIGGSLLDN